MWGVCVFVCVCERASVWVDATSIISLLKFCPVRCRINDKSKCLFSLASHAYVCPPPYSAAGVSASFGEMLLLVAMYFHSNQLSSIIELVCSTLGMKVRW